MTEPLLVTSSPHFRANWNVTKIMGCVLLALLPCVIASAVIFGLRALLVVIFCAACCVMLEFVCRRVMKRDQTISDLSAAVTGVILALTLPVNINLSLAFVGCVVAIVVVKQCFGGIGMNFVNPAIAARVVMLVSFPTEMTAWTVDGVTSATYLNPEFGGSLSYVDMLLGKMGGSMGETCKIAILVGGIFLIVTRVIKPWIPLSCLCTVAIFSYLAGVDVLSQLLTGGLLFGAFFMATDYTTSPITDLGKVIFGVGIGVLTMIIRLWASLPEGVSYAILLMNILVPYIEKATKPKSFGFVKGAKA